MSGFSLIELLLVIALFSVVTVYMFPMSMSLYFEQALKESQATVISVLRNAQTAAVMQQNDSDIGVAFLGMELVLFEGSTYATRNDSKDITYSLPSLLTYEGVTEIVFEKFTGSTQATGTISLELAEELAEVKIFESGLVE